jgi:Rieske 2Fe-2S family protein
VGLALADVEVTHTGGSLKWMGVTAPWVNGDPYRDLGHVIAGFSREEFARFVALADDPDVFDLDRRADYAFGDETDHPLNARQVRYLKYQHGVYFPWKVCFHLLENDRWEHSGEGKAFAEAALRHFPTTVAFVKRLPFREIGRCVLFGLEANDHAPMHRDSEPGRTLVVPHSISFDPRGTKRFVLADPEGTSRRVVESRAYWFNDMDWHGVEPDPFFRYSIRVDGVFERGFLEELRAHVAKGHAPGA